MIVGVDEVGRGAWAGPLCVAAVGLGGISIDKLTDSKKLTKIWRNKLALEIRQQAPLIGIGWVSAKQIDKIGMSMALRSAATEALKQIDSPTVDQIIIDGTIKLINDPRAVTMKQADLLVPSVSAASIIAKTARDDYMMMADNIFSGYNFTAHVGYGTAAHLAAIVKNGPTPLHRMSFKPMSSAGAVKNVENKTNSTSVGQKAESVAADYLLQNGFKIEMRNFRTKLCEIDIVASKQKIIYFVEVKYRRSLRQGGGVAAITPRKLKSMEFAAKIWFQRYGLTDAKLSFIEVRGDNFSVSQFIDQVQL